MAAPAAGGGRRAHLFPIHRTLVVTMIEIGSWIALTIATIWIPVAGEAEVAAAVVEGSRLADGRPRRRPAGKERRSARQGRASRPEPRSGVPRSARCPGGQEAHGQYAQALDETRDALQRIASQVTEIATSLRQSADNYDGADSSSCV